MQGRCDEIEKLANAGVGKSCPACGSRDCGKRGWCLPQLRDRSPRLREGKAVSKMVLRRPVRTAEFHNPHGTYRPHMAHENHVQNMSWTVQNEVQVCPKWGSRLAGPATTGKKSYENSNAERVSPADAGCRTGVQNELQVCPKCVTGVSRDCGKGVSRDCGKGVSRDCGKGKRCPK